MNVYEKKNIYIYVYIYEGIFNYGRIKHHKSILVRGGNLGGFAVVILFGIFFKDTGTIVQFTITRT